MNKKAFINALKNSSNKEITKDDLQRVGEEKGIEFPKKISRDKIIDLIVEKNFEFLYEAFEEFLYVPVWEVADYYNLTTEKINKLQELGIIKEQPKEKEFYNKYHKDYYTANTYPLDILDNYTKEELKEAYDNAYGGTGYKIRIETIKEDEVSPIVEELEKVFDIPYKFETYEHRNKDGYYTYLSVKLINDTDIKKDALRLEIDKLNRELKTTKEELRELEGKYKGEVRKLKNMVRETLGVSCDEELLNLYANTFHKVSEDNISLKKEIEELKNNSVQKIKNERGAGRKSKIDNNIIATVTMLKLQGKSIRKISEEIGLSVGTVHKIINKHIKEGN